jgi:serine/threonine protein kinase
VSTSRLGNYSVLGRLARGSTADVWLAIPDDKRLPRRVVLKQLYPHLAGNDDFVRMFLDEVTLQARFSHPNIVRAYDLDDDDDGPFAALGLVDGPNAATALRLHGQALPVDVVVEIGVAVARALHAVHTHQHDDGTPLVLSHRDVTPENILVGRDGQVRLTDFGVARSGVGRALGTLVSKETTPGTRKGKSLYLAPEQVTGRVDAIGAATDLYALGATLWCLLVGRPPFSRQYGDVALFDAIVDVGAAEIASCVPEIDPELADLVDTLLQRRAVDRPASAAVLQQRLEALAREPDAVARFVAGLGLPSLTG